MKRVFVCSPYAEYQTSEYRVTIDENITIAREGCKILLSMGYAPLAPHLLYPEILNDGDENDRKLGIRAGLAFLDKCDAVVVLGTHISKGMQQEIKCAIETGIPIYTLSSYMTEKGDTKYRFQLFYTCFNNDLGV